MFLLIFRYVFGGAIHTGTVSYVDFLVPGFVVTERAVRRASARRPAWPRTSRPGSSTGSARCRSPAAALMAGRALADTVTAHVGPGR